MSKRSKIPVHSLDKNALGVEVKQLRLLGEMEDSFNNQAHRDDYYVFIFQERGTARMMIDFKEVEATGSGVFCIHPGQVHHGVALSDVLVWFLAVDVSLVSEQFRSVFEESYSQPGLADISTVMAGRLATCFALLAEVHQEQNQYQVMRSLLDAVTGMMAGIFAARIQNGHDVHSRTTIITRQFKELLKRSFRELKRPAAYAEALNISPSYLNEAVKLTTGLPVSHWIQEEVIREAKRLLFYTGNTVKQIADDLGFEDHTYFTRVFTRAEGMPPLAFRKEYRK